MKRIIGILRSIKLFMTTGYVIEFWPRPEQCHQLTIKICRVHGEIECKAQIIDPRTAESYERQMQINAMMGLSQSFNPKPHSSSDVVN